MHQRFRQLLSRFSVSSSHFSFSISKMLKKKLNSVAQFSRLLLHRRGSSTASCSSSNTSLKPNAISRTFSNCSSSFSSPIRARQERYSFTFSSSRVFQHSGVYSGLFAQNLNLFCSGSSFAEKLQCWNCNSVPTQNSTPFLVCQTCRSVQPVDHSIDYFQILGLDKKYDIEGDNLEGKYKDWQKKLHPDLVHTKSQKEQEYAAEQSARVTDSYRTLTNPLSRAKYMMKLEGVEMDEEERITDPELLSEIMEIREAVEEAAETQELHQIQEKIRGKLEYWSTSFGSAFNSRNYDEAVNSIRRMTYYVRAIEEIVKKL